MIDPIFKHSFIVYRYMRNTDSLSEYLDFVLTFSTPLRKAMLAELVCRSCVFRIRDKELFVDLIMLDMRNFDIILGMNWLIAHHATIHCYSKDVVFHLAGHPEFSCQGKKHDFFLSMIFVIQEDKLLQRCCQGYLSYVVGS